MSWPLASFLLLGAALAVGFGWYERTRPSARLLSVVGTLAALAIVGRIAFAAIPNVKPTTDIVLIAGYALGGAPGFAVGAVTALGSNLFFGQGPWTPWQMGAWGMVGIAGALLAKLGVRAAGRLGRFQLAVACGVCGFLFGAILDFSTWVTGSGAHTLDEYLTISGVSLPFNVAHAVGNVVFFLAFGPALIRAVERSRARFEITWQPAAGVLLATLLVAGAATPQRAQAASRVERAVSYLQAARNSDGGWGGMPGQASNGLHTAWAAYAMAAAGAPVDASEVLIRRLGTSKEIGDIERTILGLAASGANPHDAGGRDLVDELLAKQQPSGSIAGYTSYTSYGILALRSVNESRGIEAAGRWLLKQQNRDGGFAVYRRGGPSNADDTAGAIEALVAGGRAGRPIARAVGYLRKVQRTNGGWALSTGAPANAQSTAFAILGLVAARVNPAKVAKKGHTGYGYLRARQAADGSFRYSPDSAQTPVWVTAQAVLALTKRPLPVVPARARDGPNKPPGWAIGRFVATLLDD